MLTQDDKQWIEKLLNQTLDQRFKLERDLMREFITEGRRQDRIWTDRRIEYAVEDFARTVALGFDEVHVHLKKLEHPQTVPLF